MIDPQAVADEWFIAMRAAGEPGTLRRVEYGQSPVDATVYVKQIRIPTRQSSEDLDGITTATRRKYLILFEDVGTWPVPIMKDDRLIVNGRTMIIMIVDDVTRRLAGTQMAIEVEVSGA